MIIINNEEALRVVCEDVRQDEINDLVHILESELDQANKLGKGGIGLAAPQIGIAKNIAIIRLGGTNINLINAKLEKGFDQTIFRQEGCLSFPGRVEDTLRFQEVHILNEGSPSKFVATGLLSVVCQHELDHLNSTLFIDKTISKPVTSINLHKVKPNEPCPCGKIDSVTGKVKKFKKCCWRNI